MSERQKHDLYWPCAWLFVIYAQLISITFLLIRIAEALDVLAGK